MDIKKSLNDMGYICEQYRCITCDNRNNILLNIDAGEIYDDVLVQCNILTTDVNLFNGICDLYNKKYENKIDPMDANYKDKFNKCGNCFYYVEKFDDDFVDNRKIYYSCKLTDDDIFYDEGICNYWKLK